MGTGQDIDGGQSVRAERPAHDAHDRRIVFYQLDNLIGNGCGIAFVVTGVGKQQAYQCASVASGGIVVLFLGHVCPL